MESDRFLARKLTKYGYTTWSFLYLKSYSPLKSRQTQQKTVLLHPYWNLCRIELKRHPLADIEFDAKLSLKKEIDVDFGFQL